MSDVVLYNWERVRVYYIVQIVTGSLSLTGSSIMCTSIALSTKSLSTPYRRLVFGLSFSDILSSLSLVIGPFAVPAGTRIPTDTFGSISRWASGNVATCNLNGLGIIIGFCGNGVYTMGLCIYYIIRQKEKVPDDIFFRNTEIYMHIFFIIFSALSSIFAWVTGNINSSRRGRSCSINRCNATPGHECREENFGAALNFFVIVLPGLIYFSGIVICMAILIRNAEIKLRDFRMNTTSNNISSPPEEEDAFDDLNLPDYSSGASVCSQTSRKAISTIEAQGNHSSMAIRDDLQREEQLNMARISQLYKKEVFLQAVSYIGVYFLVSIALIWAMFYSTFGKSPSNGHLFQIVLSITSPLGGFINIFIHTRPHVAALRRRDNSRYSWFQAFLIVLKTGGDLPAQDGPDTHQDDNEFVLSSSSQPSSRNREPQGRKSTKESNESPGENYNISYESDNRDESDNRNISYDSSVPRDGVVKLPSRVDCSSAHNFNSRSLDDSNHGRKRRLLRIFYKRSK